VAHSNYNKDVFHQRYEYIKATQQMYLNIVSFLLNIIKNFIIQTYNKIACNILTNTFIHRRSTFTSPQKTSQQWGKFRRWAEIIARDNMTRNPP
jgi:hypothetical protein